MEGSSALEESGICCARRSIPPPASYRVAETGLAEPVKSAFVRTGRSWPDWSVAGVAIAMAIVGFTWGGWVTGGTAEAAASQRASSAVVVALAPICVEKFQRATDVPTNLAALKKTDSWSQGEFVEKGGWATIAGTNPPAQVTAVAKACALLLAA